MVIGGNLAAHTAAMIEVEMTQSQQNTRYPKRGTEKAKRPKMGGSKF
jgi:hypothetical protein